MLRFGGVLVALLATGLLSGCGNGGDPPTATPEPTPTTGPATRSVPLDAFIDELCAAFNPYYAEFSARTGTFEGSLVPSEHKARQVALLEVLLELAKPLSVQADGLPLPDVDGGDEIRELYVEALKAQELKLDRFVTHARTWDDSSQEALDADIAEISATDEPYPLEERLNELGERFPAAPQSISLIDSRPDDCAVIFIA